MIGSANTKYQPEPAKTARDLSTANLITQSKSASRSGGDARCDALVVDRSWGPPARFTSLRMRHVFVLMIVIVAGRISFAEEPDAAAGIFDVLIKNGTVYD